MTDIEAQYTDAITFVCSHEAADDALVQDIKTIAKQMGMTEERMEEIHQLILKNLSKSTH